MPHIHDKIDFCSEVFIVHKNTVLLRRHDKYKIWLSVGGHVELHEDPSEAAIREVKEEVGLDVNLHGDISHFVPVPGSKELIPPVFMNRHKISDSHEHVVLVYFATSNTDKLEIPEHEFAPCRWFAFEELDDPLYDIKPGIKHYAKEALRKLGRRS